MSKVSTSSKHPWKLRSLVALSTLTSITTWSGDGAVMIQRHGQSATGVTPEKVYQLSSPPPPPHCSWLLFSDSLCLPVCPSVSLSLSVCLSVYTFLHVPVSLSLCMSLCFPVFVYVPLFPCLCVCPSVSLSLCMSLCFPVFVCTF